MYFLFECFVIVNNQSFLFFESFMFLEAHVSAYLSYLFVANSLVVKPKAVALSKVLLLFANTFYVISYEDLNF